MSKHHFTLTKPTVSSILHFFFRLRATVKSFPKPDVIWFRNGVRLRGDANVKLQPVNDEYNVIVRNLKLTDAGVYRCEATTSAGSSFKEFTVEVKGKM